MYLTSVKKEGSKIFDLPMGWTIASLGDIVEINPRHPKSLDGSLPVTFVPMSALSETGFSFQFSEERLLGEVRKGYTHFAEGDVLFAKITPCMENGKAALALRLKNGLGCGTTELHVLRPRKEIEAKYLYHFIHQDSFRKEAVQKFTGTAGQLRVPVLFIREAEIPLPSVDEQRRIVAKLEKLLARVDACRERLDKIPVIIKRFRQSVRSAACSGRLTDNWREEHPDVEPALIFLERIVNDYKEKTTASPYSYSRDNDIPESWILCNLGTLAELITKGSSPNWQGINYVEHGILFVTSENVGSGHLILENKKFVEEKFNQIQKRSILKRGDILTNIVGASIGRTAIFDLDEKANINQAVSLIRLKNKMSPSYILTVLNSPAIVDFMNSTKVDVARANLSLKDVASLPIPLPPITEQQEIVRRVEALFKIADQIEERYRKARTHVEKLTQSILAKAFRGKLVSQDPNGEPASALLTSIRQERNDR